MGIVNELQASAESEDVLTVVRKAKRVASKLNRNDISDWLGHEQNGYPSGVEVPDYRQIPTTIFLNTNGPIPAGFGYVQQGLMEMTNLRGMDQPYHIGESIGTVVSWITETERNSESATFKVLDDELAGVLRSTLNQSRPDLIARFTFLARLSNFAVKEIPNRVKDRILDWALVLEQAGVHGDEHSFSPQEKQTAENLSYVFNDNRITAESQNGPIQIHSPHATQTSTVTVDPTVFEAIQKINDAAASAEVDDVDRQDIKASLDLIQQLMSKQITAKAKLKINEKLSAIGSVATMYKTIEPQIHHWITLIQSHLPF